MIRFPWHKLRRRLLAAALPLALCATMYAQDGSQTTTLLPQGFSVVRQNAITPIRDQHRSGTCWDYATLALLESEVLRAGGPALNLCEMFVVNKDYMDNAVHYVRMHGHSELTEGGSADDVLEVVRTHGICPEEAMPAPGSLVGDSLANFESFVPELKAAVEGVVAEADKHPAKGWQAGVQAIIDRYVGACPDTFDYEGHTYSPKSFAESLNLQWDDYVSLTSFSHHTLHRWFVIEAPYKWRLKPSYNLSLDELVAALDKALLAGYCVAWGGDVSGDFNLTGIGRIPSSIEPTAEQRQSEFDNWTFTYDHVMLIYGIARDRQGHRYYMVKNSWGRIGPYGGTWYLSADYVRRNTTYLFLNRRALPAKLRKEMMRAGF